MMNPLRRWWSTMSEPWPAEVAVSSAQSYRPNGKATRGPTGQKSVDFIPMGGGKILDLTDGARPDADRLTRAIAYATSAYAFAAIDYRASRIAEPPLMVVREDEDGEEWMPEHELAMVLMEPSPDYDMSELQYLTEAYQLITGQALWVMDRDRVGRVGRFTPFSADEFKTESANGLIFGRYKVETADGPKTYPPEEVIHFRDPHPGSWREGISRLDVALSSLDLGHQVMRTVRNYARRAIFPGGVISPHPDWNPDDHEFEQYKNAIRSWHGGPANAGEPLVALGGTTFSPTAADIGKILPVDLLDRLEAVIGSVFGIPPIVLGWQVGLKNSPWSQMGEARRAGYEETIEPRWRDRERRLTRKLMTPEERDQDLLVKFDTSQVRALFDDDAAKATVAAQMRREWTRNERRLYTGQQPLDDGDERGDEIEGSSEGGDPFGLGSLGELSANGGWIERKGWDEKALVWFNFDESTKAAAGTWERIVARGLAEQKAAIVRLAKASLRNEKSIRPDTGDVFRSEVEKWLAEKGIPLMRAMFYPLVLSTATAAAKQVTARVGISFNLIQDALLEYVDREVEFLVESMGETTGKAVASIVQKGLESGDTVGELTKRLQRSAAFKRTRAKLVARTETTRAWNGAQRESMSEYSATSGRTVMKAWLSSQDDRVRDEHVALDGEQVAIDAQFSNGLEAPGEPNCRCTMIYSIADTVR